jgi:segregation and condensation protein B
MRSFMKIPGCVPRRSGSRPAVWAGCRKPQGPLAAWTRWAKKAEPIPGVLPFSPPAWANYRRTSVQADLEALLFSSEDPLPLDRMKAALGLDSSQVLAALQELRRKLDGDDGAFVLQEVAGGWRLATRGELDRYLDTSLGKARTDLNETLRDTLAIVAYRQPVTRAQVEAVRGVPCADSLRQLLDLGLIRMAGREATLGRPVIYRTSRKFLLWCGLRSLDDLPPLAGS